MDEKSAQMAEQLRKNPAMLKSLMQSRDGQTLMRMLTQDDGGAGLRKAVQSAAKGDAGAMTQMDHAESRGGGAGGAHQQGGSEIAFMTGGVGPVWRNLTTS